jgi:hypothetical protein
MRFENIGKGVAQRGRQASAALDIAEEERDGPARQIPTMSALSPLAGHSPPTRSVVDARVPPRRFQTAVMIDRVTRRTLDVVILAVGNVNRSVAFHRRRFGAEC